MIRSIALYESESFDPHYNLAVEQVLLERAEDSCILYLWQNENTVVIGRNQNPWKECKTALLAQEGGHLARRLSGGGAVFHDLGNLNFTFLMPREDYDLDRQLTVIQRAVESLGIPARRSGRNDVLTGDRKFSGNAFYKNASRAYHHGTLLVDADMEKLSRYLSPSRAKLQAKGVDSVRSRVINLKERNPELTIPMLKEALKGAFCQVYGQSLHTLSESDLDPERVGELTERNRSWEWNYGQKLPFSLECQGRFPWGGVELQLGIESGRIRQAKVYSDSMDWALVPRLEEALRGCRFDRDTLGKRLEDSVEARDVYGLLCEQGLE